MVNTKICSKCNKEKEFSLFHNGSGKYGLRPDCKECVKKRQQENGYYGSSNKIRVSCPRCGGGKTRYSKVCRQCDKPSYDQNNPRWFKHHSGYIYARIPEGKHISQHRYVMEKKLGRKLSSDENVHHINGIRDDNRLENLELWSTSQPSGQRVIDKIDWARKILSKYNLEDELLR